MSGLQHIQNMPAPVKAGGILVGGGSFLAVLTVMLPKAVPALLIGIVVVGLLLVLYRFVLKLLDKRKSNPFAKSIQQSSAAPAAISEPAKRARLDDLRRTFEGGVEKFKSAGKDIYSVPWYLLVGEPGSGKTEAIRHCNVGFPPGLQDQLQGAGGTLNMNWWFTNHAIILDTAGRLMFEEAPPGQTSEWQEFLKLLRSARPNCPINGMLLVIPADSLIRDRADAIETKAGKVAQQLDNIQRSLGVRFPVFVIVTKCDLINGFREFFDSIDDPQLQHQIVGWTNPADLDHPFKPEQVEQHLATVRERFTRRRGVMLQDPVHTESPQQRRIDQVDALFSFPESLMQIGPRLRRYLEMIFVAGEWSSKPLFLRGIYFTSSMREGSALDADLAEALGVALESLPEGRVWERDRAYFLRDLFVGKVFKEKGLVTRAGNVRKAQRRKQAVLLGGGLATVAVLLGLTVFGAITFGRTIDAQREYWASVSDQVRLSPEEFDLLSPTFRGSSEFRYRGADKLTKVAAGPELQAFLAGIPENVSRPVGIPAIFRPVASLSGDLDDLRADTARAIVEGGVLRSGITAAMARLSKEPTDQPWKPDATRALSQIVRLDSLASGVVPAGGSMVDVESIYRYVLGEEFKNHAAAVRDIQRSCDTLLAAGAWRAAASNLVTPPLRESLAQSVRQWVAQWDHAGIQAGTLGGLNELRAATASFKGAEDRLLDIARPYFDGKSEPGTIAEYEQRRAAWEQEYPRLDEAATAVAAASERLATELAKHATVVALCEAARTEALARAQAEFDLVGSQTRPATPAAAQPTEGSAAPAAPQGSALAPVVADGWTAVDRRLREMAEGVRTDLAAAEKEYLALVAGSGKRAWEFRAAMYAAADARLRASAAVAPALFGGLPALAGAAAAEDEQALRAVADNVRAAGAAPRAGESEKTAQVMIRLAARRRAHTWVQAIVDAPPGSAAEFGSRLADLLSRHTSLAPVPRPAIPLTAMNGGEFDQRFNPGAAQMILGEWKFVMEAVGIKDLPGRALDAPALAQRAAPARALYEQYARDYVEYWSKTVPEREAGIAIVPWTEFYTQVRAMKAFQATGEVRRLLGAVATALEAIPAELAEESGARAARARAAAEIQLLEGEEARRQFNLVREAITALGEEAPGARAQILSLKKDQIEHGLLETYAGKDKGIRFLNDLLLGCLTVLSDAAQKDGRAALAALASANAFPLCRDCPPQRVLSREEVAAAFEHVARLGLSGGAAVPRTAPTATVAQGARTGAYPEIDKQLDLLAGEELFAGNPRGRDWARKLVALAEFLRAQPAQTCSLEILTADDQTAGESGAALATYTYRFIEIQPAEGEAIRIPTDQPRPGALKFKLPGPRIALRFQRTTQDPPEAEIVLPESWNAVTLIQTAGAKLDKAAEQGKETLKVPLSFTDTAGQKYVYWVGVTFERPVPWPLNERWPTHDEWPKP
ncbi:MAG: type VI secretion protein IcmF/TssM N-terminal domain-containing protein [Phycisphaerales bacterium]